MAEIKVAVLMTCFNRVDKTLACLASLYAAVLPVGYLLDIYLVDDGSTDGTSERVKERYPSVNVLQGSGSLYWAGGMRLAWSEAAKSIHDYYLWLNDDTFLFEDGLSVLLSSSIAAGQDAIICSTVVSKSTGKVTYGGKMRGADAYITPSGNLEKCEIISGNCVLVPNTVFGAIGSIDQSFLHAIGDYDYGLRAVGSGFKCYVAPKVIGICESNPSGPKWCLKHVSFFERVRALYSPLGNAQPRPYFIYVKRHFGLFQAVKQIVSMHIRVVFPQLWKL